jgi:hypothetical protein
LRRRRAEQIRVGVQRLPTSVRFRAYYALSGNWAGFPLSGRGWPEVALGEAWGDLPEGRFGPVHESATSRPSGLQRLVRMSGILSLKPDLRLLFASNTAMQETMVWTTICLFDARNECMQSAESEQPWFGDCAVRLGRQSRQWGIQPDKSHEAYCKLVEHSALVVQDNLLFHRRRLWSDKGGSKI